MLRSNIKNLFLYALSLALLCSLNVHANFNEMKKEELPNIEKLLGTSKKLDTAAIKSYINKALPESSNEYHDLIIAKLNKTSISSRASKMAELLFSEKKYLKASEACYSATNQCLGKMICDFPTRVEGKSVFEKCLIPKNKDQNCSVYDDYCMEGSCKRLTRVTSINTCNMYKDSCSKNSDCCSNSCNKSTRTCEENYKCTSCVGVGNRPGKKQVCCDSLFKNSRGICAPILPSFSRLIIELLFPSAQAAVESSAQKRITIVNTKDHLKKLLEENGINETKISSYIAQIDSSISTCDSKPIKVHQGQGDIDYPRQDCFSSLIADVKIEYDHQREVAQKRAEATSILDNFKEQTRSNQSHPQHEESAFNSFSAPYLTSINSCINSNTDLGNDNKSGEKSKIDNCINNLKVNINDAVIEADYKSMLAGGDSTSPDYSLYTGMDGSSPLFYDVSTSDMKSCRVNLFGDFLAKQSNGYFEMMMMMFAMDYTTGGKDEGDFFHIMSQYNTEIRGSGNYTGTSNQVYNWNTQINSMRGYDFDLFDPSIVGKGKALWDQFDESVGEGAVKEIREYLENLPANEKKIFLHLFYNGKLTGEVQNNIINYYMKNDDQYLAEFSGANPKDSGAVKGRYNIRDVVRFEAIKYKHSLYKLYSTLRKRSLEMMCRCVDTVGPMSPSDWLQDDVEANYLANCNGLGMYDSYVLDSEKTVCDENGENCNNTGSKDYLETINKKEREALEEAGGNESIVENSVGKTIVQNEGYSVEQREGDYFVQTLDQVTACIGSGECEKTSRYGDFVKSGKVNFDEERKETAKGHGEDFSMFLRDMALMKIKAIEDASLQNISQGTALFEYTVQWLKEYNWNYIKYNGQKYTLSRKCLYPVCWIMEMMKFLGLHKNSLFTQIVNISTAGLGGVLSDTDMDLDPERGPENICGPRTKSSWKVARITVGKKYKIKCMKFHSKPNDVCNKEMAVGVCSRNTYVRKEGGVAFRVIDPFLPDMSSNYNTAYRSSAPIPFNSEKHKPLNYHALNDNVLNYYRDHAKGYFLSTLVSVDNGDDGENSDRKRMAEEFAQYAYRYHFYAPKVTKLDYYITPGLIPYFELLIAKLNNYNGQTLANLSSTAAYALKMHNYYHTVREGLTNSTKVERKETHQGLPDIQLNNSFGQFTNWLSGFSTAADTFKDALSSKNSANSSVRGRIKEGASSENSAIAQLSKGLSKQIARNDQRREDIKLMKDTLKSRGKSGDFDELQKVADEHSSIHDSNLSSLTDSFMNNTFGDDAANRARRMARTRSETGENSNGSDQEGLTQDAINPDSLKNASSASKTAAINTNLGAGSGNANDISVIDFSNLDDTEGLFEMDDEAIVSLGGSKMTAGQLKDHLRKVKEKGSQRARRSSQDKEWERDGVTLFQMISQRYQLHVYPKVIE